MPELKRNCLECGAEIFADSKKSRLRFCDKCREKRSKANKRNYESKRPLKTGFKSQPKSVKLEKDEKITGYSILLFCYRCKRSFVGDRYKRPEYCPDCRKELENMPEPYSKLNQQFNERS